MTKPIDPTAETTELPHVPEEKAVPMSSEERARKCAAAVNRKIFRSASEWGLDYTDHTTPVIQSAIDAAVEPYRTALGKLQEAVRPIVESAPKNNAAVDMAIDAIKELKSQLAVAVEALEYYAVLWADRGRGESIRPDGKVAIEALRKLKGGE